MNIYLADQTLGIVALGFAQLLGACISAGISRYAGSKALLVGCSASMSVILGLIGIYFKYK